MSPSPVSLADHSYLNAIHIHFSTKVPFLASSKCSWVKFSLQTPVLSHVFSLRTVCARLLVPQERSRKLSVWQVCDGQSQMVLSCSVWQQACSLIPSDLTKFTFLFHWAVLVWGRDEWHSLQHFPSNPAPALGATGTGTVIPSALCVQLTPVAWDWPTVFKDLFQNWKYSHFSVGCWTCYFLSM